MAVRRRSLNANAAWTVIATIADMTKWLAPLIAIVLFISASSAQAATSHQQNSSAPSTGFLSQPTEQLSVPGNVASGEITPEGDVYTGWAEYQLFAGTNLQPWSQPTRIAPDPSTPDYFADLRRGPIQYQQQVFTVEVAGQPIVYLTLRATNVSEKAANARVAMQLEFTRGQPIATFDDIDASPYRYPRPVGQAIGRLDELGEVFDPSWVYSVSGRDITRNGELLARGPDDPAAALTTTGNSLTSPHAKEAYSARLAPNSQQTWTWQIPLSPTTDSPTLDQALEAEPLGTALFAFSAFWQAQEAGAMSISVPETAINNIYRDSLTNILAARYLSSDGWIQAVNKLQYQAFWLRDSSIMTVALDQANLHTPAGRNLGFLPEWQQPDGLYISQADEYDGIGEALWEIGQHAQLTDSASFASSELPSVSAAVGWIANQAASGSSGLLPPSTVSADERIGSGLVTGDNVWAAVGLRSAISLAQLAGRSDLVSSWQALDATFEGNLDQALAADQAAYGHITPVLGQTEGNDWGNFFIDYPMEIVPPQSVETSRIISWEIAHSDQGLADYADPRFLHDYLGFPIFDSELNRGGASVAEAIHGLYAETDHTTASGGGWEDGPVGITVRSSTDNLAPHGTFAGQYISLIHNLLVNDQTRQITLLAGVAPAWMAPGDHIRVARADTSAGPVNLTLTVTTSGATLRWSLKRFAGNTEPLVWALPYWVHSAMTGNARRVVQSLTLPADQGTVTLRFSSKRPRQSLDRAIAQLNRAYTAHGQPAPLQPAHDW
jgi:hypothetical protein